jgi:hypothetical protein
MGFLRTRHVIAVALTAVSLVLAACGGSSSSSYPAFAQAKYTNDCEGAGSTVSACKCTLLYAEAHKLPVAMLTAADDAFEAGTNDPQWLVSAAEDLLSRCSGSHRAFRQSFARPS